MTRTYHYRVAGFRFAVVLPAEQHIETLLPSFLPFRCEEGADEELFRMEVCSATLPDDAGAEVWEESENDMGTVRLMKTEGGYRVSVRLGEGSDKHRMAADCRFSRVKVYIDWQDPWAGQVLGSMLRIAFAQSAVYRQAVSVHASTVCVDGKGYLFMGKSGTGKSTHAALWQQAFDGCRLLNDDNPTVRLQDGQVWVYGTPWSGKTPCYRNEGCPVQGVARLQQAAANRFRLLAEVEAFVAVLPGCAVIRQDAEQYDALCATLVQWVGSVRVGCMECLPDKEAAEVSRKALEQRKQI